MRTAADFLGKLAYGISFYLFPVLAFEKPRKALRLCLFERHFTHNDGDIERDLLVYQPFHFRHFFGSELAREVEVEAQTLFRNVTAALFYIGRAYLFQSGVQQVRCSVQVGGKLLVVGKSAGEFLLAARAGFCLMLGIRRFVALCVYRHTLFTRHFARNFHGEAVSIVEMESGYAVYYAAGGECGNYFIKFPYALLKGFREFVFFLFEFFVNSARIFDEFGIYFGVFIYYSCRNFAQRALR